VTRIRALILDFDGVIVESNALKTEAFKAVFARFPEHASAMLAYHHAHVSESRYAKFRHLAERLGRQSDDGILAELAADFSREILARFEGCAAVPGAVALLDRVRGRIPVFLASVTPQDELEEVLRRRQLAQTFTRVYGCPPWTKATAIEDIVGSLGGVAGVLFVGDSAGDQRAARQTDVEFLARDSGLSFDEPVPPAYPDLVALTAAIASRLPSLP
jgi:phosphoglycolate phosphatase-like HAD superfamily hydrolase